MGEAHPCRKQGTAYTGLPLSFVYIIGVGVRMKVKRIVQMMEKKQYELCLRDMSSPNTLIVLLSPEEKEQFGNLFRRFETSESVVNYFCRRIREKYQGGGNDTGQE